MTQEMKYRIIHFMELKTTKELIKQGYTTKYQIVKGFLNLKRKGVIK